MLKRPADAGALGDQAEIRLEELRTLIYMESALREKLLIKQYKEFDCFIVIYPWLLHELPKIQRALHLYEKPVSQAVRDVKITKNGLFWLFSTNRQKRRAFASYNYLTDAMALGFEQAYQEATEVVHNRLQAIGEDCLQEYRQDPVYYHGELMELRREAERKK